MAPFPRLSIACLVAATVAAGAFSASPAAAASSDPFQGAWALDKADCARTFTNREGKISFAEGQDDMQPGFIVDGKRIHGTNASCELVSRKAKGDTTTLLLNCASKIMFGSMTVLVRMQDPDTMIRFDPDFPEIETTYHRCK